MGNGVTTDNQAEAFELCLKRDFPTINFKDGKQVWLFSFFNDFTKHRCTQEGREGGGGGAPHVPPIKIFEKLPHKNEIKHDAP